METSAYCRLPQDVALNKSLTRKERESLTVPHPILTNIELICNIFFASEYLLKLISSPSKSKYIRDWYNNLEFLAIMPIFFPAENPYNKNTWGVRIHNFIEVFYILRMFRIFVLVPKYSGLRVLLLAVKKSIGELMLYLLMMLMTVTVFASFVYYAEQIMEADDNKFDSVLIGFWWALVTLTTLGYGDIVPVTPVGYVVGSLCVISGMLFMVMPVPIIVNNFTAYYSHVKARQKLKTSNSDPLPNRAVALHFETEQKVYYNFYFIFNYIN